MNGVPIAISMNRPHSRCGTSIGGSVKKTLVLAVDPFVKTTVSLKSALATVQGLSDQLHADLVASTVMSPDRMKWAVDFRPSWKPAFRAVGEKAIAAMFRGSAIKAFRTSVLFQPMDSSAESLYTLVSYLRASRAAAVVVITHERAKPGFSLAGSFTSRLISKSDVPVLAIDARAGALTRVSRIVFATSFAKSEKRRLAEAIGWAKALDAELVFLNVLTGLPPNFSDGVFLVGGPQRLDAFMAEQASEAEENGKIWKGIAERAGVRAGYEIVSSTEPVADVITKVAKRRRADLIMMPTSTGPRTAFFLGSVTRDVLRKSKKAVFILR